MEATLNRLKELILLLSLPLVLLLTLYMLVVVFWLVVIGVAAAAKLKGLLILPFIYTLVPTFLWGDAHLTPLKQLPPESIKVLELTDGWPDHAFNFIHTAGMHALSASWPYLIALGIIWVFFGYRYQRKWVEVSNVLDTLPPGSAPWVEDDITAMAFAAKLPLPRLSIWAMEAPNAFASGLDDSTYKITVTIGLLTRLSHDEIRAVLAHEMGHIAAGDVRLMTLCYVYGGIFNNIADYLWLNIKHSLYGSDTTYNRLFISIPFVILIALVFNFAGGLSSIVKFALIRRREYQADRFAAFMLRNGVDLQQALGKIAQYEAPIPKIRIVRDSVIHRPVRHWWERFTATHPPIPDRQKALQNIQRRFN